MPHQDVMLSDAVNSVMKEAPASVHNVEDFIKRVSAKFIENKIDAFPALCKEARRVNFMKRKLHNDIGNTGGWSESKDFKFDYEIPRELYMFMQNLVYKEFWSEENEKVWRKFMEDIMAGEAPENLLINIKAIYGSNKDVSLI